MKKKIQTLINWFFTKKWSSKVTLKGGGVSFFKTSRIIYKQGANKTNFLIHSNARIYGELSACSNGKIQIGKYTHIGPFAKILCVDSVIIGNYTTIAPNVKIVDNNNHPIHPQDRKVMSVVPPGAVEKSWLFSEHKPIKIGNAVWIGENSYILKGVKVGDGAIVASNSVVTKDVPENSIVAGNPAKVVKENIHENSKLFFNVSEYQKYFI
ncbi:CatB-related O-acetyltransferase [Riemerella anatipestifer]|nr:CatB-related O-acetyltransferase [Riemerella anatipestifer]